MTVFFHIYFCIFYDMTLYKCMIVYPKTNKQDRTDLNYLTLTSLLNETPFCVINIISYVAYITVIAKKNVVLS